MKNENNTAYDKLLNAARILFYNNGIRATGIDLITAKAGVAKKSLYNNFSSKEALIIAYLEIRHQEWLELYQIRLKSAQSPQEKILAVFDAYQDHADFEYENGFRGCGLLNAAAEFASDSKERSIVNGHKQEIANIIKKHLMHLFSEPEVDTITIHLSILLEGSITLAGLAGNHDYIVNAKNIAVSILTKN